MVLGDYQPLQRANRLARHMVGDPVNGLDPLGLFCLGCHLPTLPTSFENWAVGTADALSFNIGKIIRDEYDLGSPDLNTCSPAYFAGKITGTAVNAAIGGVAAARGIAFLATNAEPLARAGVLALSLNTAEPALPISEAVFQPTIDAARDFQAMDTFSQEVMLETEGQVLNPTEIITRAPHP